jgi:hypothetical protein
MVRNQQQEPGGDDHTVTSELLTNVRLELKTNGKKSETGPGEMAIR